MGIVDAIIILLIVAGAVFGFKRGFTKQLINFAGFILIFVIAYYFKNPVSIFLYEHLPFFQLGGILKGVTVANILLYELIAFLLVLSVLTVIFKLLVFASGLFEKILDVTIILGLFSKILGAIVGAVEYFIIVFIGLYALSLPMFHIGILEESKLKDNILQKTPILSGMIDKSVVVINEFSTLKEKYKDANNAEDFNYEALEILLKYKVITVESVEQLIAKDKISFHHRNVNDLLEKYKEG